MASLGGEVRYGRVTRFPEKPQIVGSSRVTGHQYPVQSEDYDFTMSAYQRDWVTLGNRILWSGLITTSTGSNPQSLTIGP
ncbi:hypothetical protein TIFTF001_033770 [Ficus carica]|uniref:Uncharacterized protein n=1 Tax=Ficus carica TaxID=3494 RepID=A0AA88J9P1_FICCA|nr:hypothetical protein TIFTF001_033770 [Ficus carica]